LNSKRSFIVIFILVVQSLVVLIGLTTDTDATELEVGPGKTYTKIQDALDAASAGDVIHVDAGNYSEKLLITKSNIELLGAGVETTSLEFPYGDAQGVLVDIQADNVRISGFDIAVEGSQTKGILLDDGTSGSNISKNRFSAHGYNSSCVFLDHSASNSFYGNDMFLLNSLTCGFYIFDLCADNNFDCNSIRVEASDSVGVLLTSYNTQNTITNCVIDVEGTRSQGIWSYYSSNDNDFTKNIIDITGDWTFGIHVSRGCDLNLISSNTIDGHGEFSYGILLENAGKSNRVTRNQITTVADRADAVYLSFSNENMVDNNTIETSNEFSRGVFLWESSINSVVDNDILTSGYYSQGIYLYNGSDENAVSSNTLETRGSEALAIITARSDGNTVSDNDIKTVAMQVYGIGFREGSRSNCAMFNTIECMGVASHGVNMNSADMSKAIGNTILCYGIGATGVYANNSDHVIINLNHITNNNQMSRGINILFSTHPNLSFNTIDVQGEDTIGIRFKLTSNGDSMGDIVTLSGTNANGIMLDYISSQNLFTNTTVNADGKGVNGVLVSRDSDLFHFDGLDLNANSASVGFYQSGGEGILDRSFMDGPDVEIMLREDAILNTVMTEFDGVRISEPEYSGTINDWTSMSVHVTDRNMTPVKDVSLKISDENNTYYATSIFAGKDEQTDEEGRTDPVEVLRRVFDHSADPIHNSLSVRLKSYAQGQWDELRYVTDLEFNHVEDFVLGEHTKPPVPNDVEVFVMDADQSINVRWTGWEHADSYKIEASCNGNLTRYLTVDHPVNEAVLSDLTDGRTYRITVRTINEIGVDSDPSLPLEVTLEDRTPPMVPGDLSATSVEDDDLLNISWSANDDDTVAYEIRVVSDDGTYDEEFMITNRSSTNITVDEGLVDGVKYHLSIRAMDPANHFSNFSDPVSVIHVDGKPPSSPKGIAATYQTETTIEIEWEASPDDDIQGYLIYMALASLGPISMEDILFIEDTYATIEGLEENETYSFWLAALDEAGGLSILSGPLNATTQVVPPDMPFFDEFPSKTDEPSVTLEGHCEEECDLLVYREGAFEASTFSDEAGNFLYDLELTVGENEVTFYVRDDGRTLSEPFTLTIVRTGEDDVDGDDDSDGDSVTVGEDAPKDIKVNGEEHTLSLSHVDEGEGYAVVDFGDIDNIMLKLYKENLVDLDGDGVDDARVTLMGFDKEGDPIIKIEPVPQDSSDDDGDDDGSADGSGGGSDLIIAGIVSAIVIIVLVAFFFIYKRKDGRTELYVPYDPKMDSGPYRPDSPPHHHPRHGHLPYHPGGTPGPSHAGRPVYGPGMQGERQGPQSRGSFHKDAPSKPIQTTKPIARRAPEQTSPVLMEWDD